MTIAQRERELTRLTIEHPGQTTAQLAHFLTLPVTQAETTLLTLRHRAVVECVGDRWYRRRSDVRAWRRAEGVVNG